MVLGGASGDCHSSMTMQQFCTEQLVGINNFDIRRSDLKAKFVNSTLTTPSFDAKQ